MLPNVKTFTQEMNRITHKGFIDYAGIEHEVDVIICATGYVPYHTVRPPDHIDVSSFDTSWVPRFPIVSNGINVQDIFGEKAISYLSIGVPDS